MLNAHDDLTSTPAPTPHARTAETRSNATAIIAIGLAGIAVFVLLPFAVPCILGAWMAELARPLLRKVERIFFGRRGAAAVVTLLLLLAILAPLLVTAVALFVGASELIADIRHAVEGGDSGGGAQSAVAAAAPSFIPTMPSGQQLLDLTRSHGATAMRIASGTLQSSARMFVAFVIFVGAFHTCALHRERVGQWLQRSLPVAKNAYTRLTDAFYETGRGLFVGVGLAALAQGIVATIIYLALGIPRALVLGFVTAVAAIIPGVGAAVVWVPITIVLAVSGHPIRALILGGCGIAIISVIDNILRPFLARYGKLRLSTFLLFASMMGGIFALGPAGVIVGPLAVRMAIEGIDLAREKREKAAVASRSLSP